MIYTKSRFSHYQRECDDYIIRPLIDEMYLQRVQKSTLSQFDDKRCYESIIESEPWKRKSSFCIVTRFCPLTFHLIRLD